MGSQQEMHLDPQYPCSVVKQVPSSDSSQGFLLQPPHCLQAKKCISPHIVTDSTIHG